MLKQKMNSNRVLIFGSCATRDIFNHGAEPSLKLLDIFARTSPVSLVSPSVQGEFDLSRNKSAFQRRMVSWDMSKHFWSFIEHNKFDLIVFDFIDERFRHVYFGVDRWITMSNELIETGLVTKNDPNSFGWPEEKYKSLFTEGISKIQSALQRFAPEAKVVLNEVYWAGKFEDGETIASYTANYINRNNEQLKWVYQQFKNQFPQAHILEYEDSILRAKRDHTWGEMPFHFQDAFYKATILQLEAVLNCTAQDKVLAKDHDAKPHSSLTVDQGAHGKALPLVPLYKATIAQLTSVFSRTKRDKRLVKDCDAKPHSSLTVDQGAHGKTLPLVSLSIDVEAVPSRTKETDKVGRLMWGKFGEQVAGVPLIIDLLRTSEVSATFFLEYLSVLKYGKAEIFEVGRYILGRQQALEVHAHPELIPAGAKGAGRASFSEMELDEQIAVMKLMRNLYRENTGVESKMLRCGGLRFNRATLLAAHVAGFSCLSNYYGAPYANAEHYYNLPCCFNWAMGEREVRELPVSACLDVIIQAGADWSERLERLLVGPSPVRHVFIHSWSLIKRDQRGLHDSFDFEYADRFREILEFLKSRYGFIDMSSHIHPNGIVPTIVGEAVLDAKDGRPVIDFGDSSNEQKGYQLSSGSYARSKVWMSWTEMDCEKFRLLSVINPTLRPVKVNTAQTCMLVDLRWSGGYAQLPYVISGKRAHVLLKREEFPASDWATEIFGGIFRRHADVDEIVFSYLYGDGLLKSPFADCKMIGSAYFLRLLNSFDEYKKQIIHKSLLKLVERKERALYRDRKSVLMRFCGASFDEELTPEVFSELVELVRYRMVEKAQCSGENWTDPYTDDWMSEHFPLYRDYGLCSFIEVDGVKVATMLNLVKDGTLAFMAGGHNDSAAPSGDTAKIIFFRTVERFMNSGGQIMQLGGGDFGYKERFGACNVSLYSGTARRLKNGADQNGNLFTGIITPLLARGCSFRDIHIFLGLSPTNWIVSEHKLPYAFDFGVDKFPAPPTGWRGWNSPNVDALHLIMREFIKTYEPLALFDWNCGAGRSLIALSEYGIKSLGGLVFSAGMADQARRNFGACNLGVSDIRMVNSSDEVHGLDLSGYDVFFAYNPCYEKPLRELADAMMRASATRKGKVYFIYLNCVYRDMLIDAGFDELIVLEKGDGRWRFSDRAAVFSYAAPDIVARKN